MRRIPFHKLGAASVAILLAGCLGLSGASGADGDEANGVSSTSAATSRSSAAGGGTFRGRHFGFVPRHTHWAPTPPPAQPTQSAATVSAAYQPDGSGDSGLMVEPMPTDELTNESYDLGHESAFNMLPNLPPPRLFVSADYLLWWTQSMELPVLATTSRADTAQSQAGVLGLRTTSTRFGDDVADSVRGGGQFTGGWWLDDSHSQAFEVSYLNLASESATYNESSADAAILARPFLNLQTGLEDARLVAFPGLAQGSLSIQAETDLETLEILMRRQIAPFCWDRVDCSFGYRYASLEEGVLIADSSTAISGPLLNTNFDLTESFRTENEFNGGQIGMRVTPAMNRPWSMELGVKVALGNTRSRMIIDGQTITESPAGATSTRIGGLLAQPSNIGTFDDSTFSAISEGDVKLRRHIGQYGAFVVGYSFLFWTDVARAGSQIDRVVDTTQIPPGTNTNALRPSARVVTDNFWAQGLRLGLEFNY